MNTSSKPALIDSHVHTDDERLEAEQVQILQTARNAGVVAQIVPAVTRELWPRLKSLCDAHHDLHACYGMHPCFCAEHSMEDVAALATWIGREKPVAVGECGLDYYIASDSKALQQSLFSAQLALAKEFSLPIVIHARQAVEDVINMIRASGHNTGVVHSYNGSAQQAHRLIDLGYSLSFGGATTFDRARKLRKLFASLPLEALLLETDAPDQPDCLHNGQLNQPAWLVDVWRNLSELRAESADEVAAVTTQNARNLFRLSVG